MLTVRGGGEPFLAGSQDAPQEPFDPWTWRRAILPSVAPRQPSESAVARSRRVEKNTARVIQYPLFVFEPLLLLSCSGSFCSVVGNVGRGRKVASYSASRSGPLVSGSSGACFLSPSKRSAEVMSPNVCRRHSLIFGSRTPVNFSRNRRTDV